MIIPTLPLVNRNRTPKKAMTIPITSLVLTLYPWKIALSSIVVAGLRLRIRAPFISEVYFSP